jgi:phenylpropionate dioxygenase-like ring-hydroxylating dioxygenase large terminal subunit
MRSPIELSDLEAAARPVEEAVGLPPACYVDPEFHDFEIAAVFETEWLCLGRSSQIPRPGDYFTATLLGHEPVIVARTTDGEINVMSSICQHRAMCITASAEQPKADWFAEPAECSGSTRSFRCPYHWWTYDLDGRLVGAPEMHQRPGFDRSEISLPRLAVEQWQGFIFCSFDEAAAPLGPRLAPFDDMLERYGLAEMAATEPERMAMPFNWKVFAENFMDAYHSSRLHASLYDFAGADLAGETLTAGTFPALEPGSVGIGGCGRTGFKDRGMNPTQTALFPPIPTLTDEDRWNVVYIFVAPTLLIGVHSDSAHWMAVQPESVASSMMTSGFLFPQETTELKLFDQLFEQHRVGVEYFFDQDMPVAVASQRGMASRFAPQGPLSMQDFFRSQLAEWLLEHYRNADRM